MRTCSTLLCSLALSTTLAHGQTTRPSSCLPRMEYDPTLTSNPDSTVTFDCEQATALDLVRATGFQTRQPIGVILGRNPQRITRLKRSYHLHHLAAKLALQQATAGTGYMLNEESGVFVLVAGNLSPRQRRVLAYQFHDFSARLEPDTMVLLATSLSFWISAAFHPRSSSMASISGATNDERLSLQVAPRATMEEIANQIVSLGSKGMWVFQAAPHASRLPLDRFNVEPYQH